MPNPSPFWDCLRSKLEVTKSIRTGSTSNIIYKLKICHDLGDDLYMMFLSYLWNNAISQVWL